MSTIELPDDVAAALAAAANDRGINVDELAAETISARFVWALATREAIVAALKLNSCSKRTGSASTRRTANTLRTCCLLIPACSSLLLILMTGTTAVALI